MNQDIKYSGYSAVPSDYECQDGQLAVAINCIPENDALKPVQQPVVTIRLSTPNHVVFIHKTTIFTHYIIRDTETNNITWIDNKDINPDTKELRKVPEALKEFDSKITIYDINAIGNTLLILTNNGTHYFLWNDTNYLYLGTHLPELPLSFGLQGRMAESNETFTIEYNESVSESIQWEWTDSMKNTITGQVLAKVNKFIAEHYTEGNEFIYPFFVRYAYRLFDGSLTMHSAPILMVTSSGQMPYVLGSNIHQTDNGWDGSWDAQRMENCKVYCGLHKLDFAVIDEKYINELKKWSNIISSVDIFISAPLYSYDQSGKCDGFKRFGTTDMKNEYCICRVTQARDAGFTKKYQYHSMAAFFWYNKSTLPGFSINLPMKGREALNENIKSCSLFYLLKSYKIEQLSTERKIIEIENGYLQSLVTREVMTDDYDSHSSLIAKYSFCYNNRLNLTGIDKKLFAGYHTAAQFPFTNGFVQAKDGYIPNGPDYTYDFDKWHDVVYVFVYIKYNGKTYITCSLAGDNFGHFGEYPYIFYPDINAYKMVLLKWVMAPTGMEERYYEVPLTPHTMLNGAVYFNAWETPANRISSSLIYDFMFGGPDNTIPIPNKIYTSEINNPFSFPVTGINTIGAGEIKGICSATKALSEGQFGQFPLYAFTTEGVWALEVSATGSYSAKQPITRDVCINADGITQLDSAVLFPTDRGIMLISGSQTQCISEPLNSEYPFNALNLPGFSKLHAMIHEGEDTCLPTLPFTEFLKKCRMIYDYVHQRVIVYAPGITYAYVYSMKSQQWGMTFSNIASHLNSYPEALAVDNDNNIVSFSESDAMQVGMLYVTRPLKLGQGSILKTVDNIIQRGNFARGHVATVLYASRDLIHWHLVWSSKDHYLRGFRGTPYKFFRIAGVANISPSENIIGSSVQFQTRQTNQPR